jgi:hypothetical protein
MQERMKGTDVQHAGCLQVQFSLKKIDFIRTGEF